MQPIEGLEKVLNDVVAPPPTGTELSLRYYLSKFDFPLKVDEVIWYSNQNHLTPDLVIGDHLVIEVEGEVHDAPHIQTHDRTRERALRMLGYSVQTVTNEESRQSKATHDKKFGKKIWHWFLESRSRHPKQVIWPVEKPTLRPLNLDAVNVEGVVNVIGRNTSGNVSADSISAQLMEIEPLFLEFPGFLEAVTLQLMGGFLRSTEKNLIDFGGGRQVFDAGAELLRARFGDNAVRGLKNAFAVTELNFIRNIVFFGGPRRNRNLVSISSLSDFRGNEMAFNEAFGSLGFSVNESEALEECYTYLEQKPNLASDHKLGWLLELQKTDRLESKTSPSVG